MKFDEILFLLFNCNCGRNPDKIRNEVRVVQSCLHEILQEILAPT